MNDKSEKKNIYQFDVLRGVAIICVFLVHTQYVIYPHFDFDYGKYFIYIPDGKDLSKYLSMSPFAFGWMGVILFFIISGFLIHYVTLKKGVNELDLWSFYNKRFWRIYPPYLIALLIFTFSQQSVRDVASNPYDFISHLFLYQTFNSNYFFSINGAFWSLAIEMQLYVLYPIFLSLRNRFKIRKTVMILLVIHVLCTLYWGTTSSFKNIVIGNLVIRHWFTWGIGAYLAECYFYKKPFLSKVPLTTLILGFILFYFSKLFVFHFATDSLFSTVLIAIIVEKYLSKKSFIMSSFEKGLTIIGLCSYSFYLMHLPILQELFLRIDLFKLREVHSLLFLSVNALPVFIIIFSISYISYLLIEKKSIGVGELILRKIKFNKKAT